MARISRINQDKEEHAYTFLHFKQMALILNILDILDILLAFSDNAESRECPDKPVRTPRERQKRE